tara:strand:- start:433 stop:1989 length:1557 start_codon:yes stop_codon:yes gene_type:complete
MLKNYGKLNVPDWVWWVGVIENRIDLAKAGRYQVRIFGYHTADTEVLPTKDLPYATVVNSPTNASTSGIMENPNLLPGSTVIGFFSDGEAGQMPVILGSIAGLPKEKNEDLTIEDGFNDPGKKYPRGGFDDPAPEGFGGVGEPDISRLARDKDAETHFSLIRKRGEREIDIRTAKAATVQDDGILDNKEGKDYEGKKWEEPYARAQGPYDTFKLEAFEPKYWDALADLKAGGTGVPKEPGTYTSMYPWNQVKETEAGFIEEIDNTAGNERYAWFHPVGNFVEHQADGTKVEKIKGSDYEIVAKDKNVFIRGSCNVTILGDAKLLVQGDKYEEVEGDYFLTIYGDRVTKIMGNDMKSVQTDQNYSIAGNRSVRVALDDSSTVNGKQTQTVLKTKTETVNQQVTEIFNAGHNTNVTKNRKEEVGGTINQGAGAAYLMTSGSDMSLLTATNMKVEAQTNMDIDANNMTIDAPTMSIDGPAGNITSNDVTLHTHTHPTTSMDTGTGANSGAKNDSDAPNAPS